jgi:hypothetical protein
MLELFWTCFNGTESAVTRTQMAALIPVKKLARFWTLKKKDISNETQQLFP